jgi:hypothetical protein
MRLLWLRYRLEGARRGYTLTDAATGEAPVLPADDLRALWRAALPRGQGWNAPALRGAHALKVLPLPSGLVALSRSVVTDLHDEAGRAGIREADVQLGTPAEAAAALDQALAALPAREVAEAERRLQSREWALLFRKVRDAAEPRSLLKPQTVLAHDAAPTAWTFMTACLLLLVTRQTLLTNLIEVSPRINPFADRLISMTTLALDPRDELRLIGMPIAAAQAAGVPFVDIRG